MSTPVLSILDLSPILAGGTAADALSNSLDLARHAEALGFHRYWLAEHHNMTGIASAATSVVIGYIAGGTQTIRVGAGGIMLPNHSPLVIAEQFGTLATLYPHRIDLGIGRAPGSDPLTSRALRRDPRAADETFPRDVAELQQYFAPPRPGQLVHAVPGAGLKVPLWLLGSSLYSARLAAAMGLPFAFASHFAPAAMEQAVAIYRETFQPSEQLAHPYVMLGVNVIAAETNEAATRLFTSLQQAFTNLLRGSPGPLPAPIDDIETYWSGPERFRAEQMLSCSLVGDSRTIAAGLTHFAESLEVDELIITTPIHDHAARKRSLAWTAEAGGLKGYVKG